MSKVLIKNGRILLIEDDGSQKSKNLSIYMLLNKHVSFDKDLTIGGFFKALKPHVDQLNLIFYSHLGGFQLQPFIKESEKKIKSREIENNIIMQCEVKWCVDVCDEDYMEWVNFGGCGKPTKSDLKIGFKKTDVIGIGLSCTPINEYKNAPLILNEDFTIDEYVFVKKTMKHKVLMDRKKRNFTFYEVIGSILHEITWHGDPNMRNEFTKKIIGIKDKYFEEQKSNKMKIKSNGKK